jgi:hypothetical protein
MGVPFVKFHVHSFKSFQQLTSQIPEKQRIGAMVGLIRSFLSEFVLVFLLV